METKTFRLIGFEEGGVQRSRDNPNLRLVCLIEGGGKLAVWGRVGSRKNIDRVQTAGMPCKIECECIQPGKWAIKLGHTYWVPQGRRLHVLSK